MNVLSTRIFGEVCIYLACSGSEADVGPVTKVIFATCEVGSGGMEFTCPLDAGLDVGALLGNSSLGDGTGGHLLPGVRLGASLLTEEFHVGGLEGFVSHLLVSLTLTFHLSSALLGRVVTVGISSVGVNKKFMGSRINFNVLPAGLRPSARDQLHLLTLLVHLVLHHLLSVVAGHAGVAEDSLTLFSQVHSLLGSGRQ
jgi:hypothetical protein